VKSKVSLALRQWTETCRVFLTDAMSAADMWLDTCYLVKSQIKTRFVSVKHGQFIPDEVGTVSFQIEY
jgi:hypothetical protein